MYIIYILAAMLMLAHSWGSFKTIIHPHFQLTVILITLFIINYIVKGDVIFDINIENRELLTYQVFTLLIIISIYLLTYLLAIRDTSKVLKTYEEIYCGHVKKWGTIHIIAVAILIIETIMRLNETEWSISNTILLSLGPRGMQPWRHELGELGGETFINMLVMSLVPFSGIVFAYYISYGKGWAKIQSYILFAAVLALLIADGTRTPILFILGALAIFVVLERRHITRKIVVLSIISVVIISVTSMVYLYRNKGIIEYLSGETKTEYALTYHHDDNLYQTIRVMAHSEKTNHRWDSLAFWEAIVLNPIPRYFWGGKPALRNGYWGEYKDNSITISFIGELVAMYGIVIGGILSVVVGVLFYSFLHKVSPILFKESGIIVYLVTALYVYMVLRSLLNITQYMYLPLFTYMAWKYSTTKIIWREVAPRNRTSR